MNGECRCILIAPPLCYLYLEWTKGVSFSSIRVRCCPNLEFVRASKLTKRAWVRSVVPVLACALPVWCGGYHLRNWWRRGVLSLSPRCPYPPFPSHIWQVYYGNAIFICASDWFNYVFFPLKWLWYCSSDCAGSIYVISCGLSVLIYSS